MEFPIAYLLAAAGGALAYAGLDLTRKVLAAEIRATPLLFLLAAGPLPFFALWVLWDGMPRVAAAYLVPGLISVLLNIGANLAFLESVRVSPLSLTIPLLSLTPVFTTLLAVPLLGEVPSALQLVGVLLVVVGAMRLNLSAGDGLSPGRALRAFLAERGSVLMAVTALLWSLAMPLDKMAMAAASVPFHGLVLNFGVALGVLVLLLAQGQTGELARARRNLPMLTWSILLSVVALGLVLLAMTQVWVGLVETLKRAVGSFSSLLLGWYFFSEEIGAVKLTAVALMALGVALILL